MTEEKIWTVFINVGRAAITPVSAVPAPTRYASPDKNAPEVTVKICVDAHPSRIKSVRLFRYCFSVI